MGRQVITYVCKQASKQASTVTMNVCSCQEEVSIHPCRIGASGSDSEEEPVMALFGQNGPRRRFVESPETHSKPLSPRQLPSMLTMATSTSAFGKFSFVAVEPKTCTRACGHLIVM